MISLLIATRNGAATIGRTLEALARQEDPGEAVEIFIVDNASQDATPQVVERFKKKLPITLLHEPTPGKNHALNQAVDLACGDKILFTDDDTLPDSNWLRCMGQAFDAQPEFDIFGGEITPVWPDDVPPETVQLVPLGAAFAVTDRSNASGPVAPIHVWGPNMAVRGEVFARGHRFNGGFGPRGREYVMGGETEFTCRVSRDGYQAFWVAGSQVGHIIRPEQLELEWIAGRAVRNGRSMFWFENAAHLRAGPPALAMSRFRFKGVPFWMWSNWLWSNARVRLSGPGTHPAARYAKHWRKGYWAGYLREALNHPEVAKAKVDASAASNQPRA